jgi:hypothetical protein
LFAATLVSLMLFLMNPLVSRWYLLVLALVLGVAFVIAQLRVIAPFIDLRVLGGNRPLIATYTRQVLAFVGAYSFLYGFTQWLEEGRGLSASSAGLLLLPLSLSAVVITVLTGRRAQIRGKLVAGSIFLIAAAGAQLITQIVLTGVATSIGVESTARAAYEHGYNVTLATDAMTDLAAESHDHALTRIFPRLGETGTTTEILALLG